MHHQVAADCTHTQAAKKDQSRDLQPTNTSMICSSSADTENRQLSKEGMSKEAGTGNPTARLTAGINTSGSCAMHTHMHEVCSKGSSTARQMLGSHSLSVADLSWLLEKVCGVPSTIHFLPFVLPIGKGILGDVRNGSWLVGCLFDSRRQDRDQVGLLVHLEAFGQDVSV